ncbi:MAG TPA: response regulator [Anaerolineales bacterium]|jgi:CheY-like chemotaxis protein|nr:response regulator [Anaerolineales bacterium]
MRNVWIVDDDEEMSRAIGLMLQVLNCEVVSFPNARSAVQKLLTGKTPQVLFLDINMPEVSGLDLLEFLRRRPEWKNLPIIMLSSESADVTIDKALLLGADAFILKPATIDEIERAMITVLDQHAGIP